MRPRERELAQRLEVGLLSYSQEKRRLLGILDPTPREALIEQIIESIRRVNYISVLQARKLSHRRADPNDELFDPLKAAILQKQQKRIDEAFWLVFIFVHFGKNARAGWRYAREIYGRLGNSTLWNWEETSADTSGFRQWLAEHQAELKRDGAPRGFGNHRKYQSLDAYSSTGTGAAVESYVRWVAPPRTHEELIAQAFKDANCDPRKAFDMLFHSMQAVASFGRTARFDYLTMLGKLGLASIEPGSAYIQNSTGPAKGAQLLFGGFASNSARIRPLELDAWLADLGSELDVGMQVLEDALCNWQKSPKVFRPFRG